MTLRVEVPIAYQQIGWQKCVACSDQPRLPGRMWLGVNRVGTDINIVCPACKGTAQVPKFRVIDMTTGKEIDYEAYGRDENGNPLHFAAPLKEAEHGA